MNLTGADSEDEMRRVERVYMGVAAIRKAFENVTEVSRDVLWVFGHLKDGIGPRDIARIVRNCRNVQYGRVGLDQLPVAEVENHIPQDRVHELKEKRGKPEEFVRILDEPAEWWEPETRSSSAPTRRIAKRVKGPITKQIVAARQARPRSQLPAKSPRASNQPVVVKGAKLPPGSQSAFVGPGRRGVPNGGNDKRKDI